MLVKRDFSYTDMLRKYLVQIRETLNQSKKSERVHRVETIDSQNLLLRNVSCYCDNCLECEECMIIAQVGSCTTIELVGDSTNSSNEIQFSSASKMNLSLI